MLIAQFSQFLQTRTHVGLSPIHVQHCAVVSETEVEADEESIPTAMAKQKDSEQKWNARGALLLAPFSPV